MNKKFLTSLFRKLGILKYADRLNYFKELVKHHKRNKDFFRQNPDIVLPPSYFIYETFNLNYHSFYNKSIDTAQWLISCFEKYKKLTDVNILDWGCGPGRVIRHLPVYIPDSCKLYGTDYNVKYINWCKKNVDNIQFFENGVAPPFSLESNYFDIIYAISIFTHLSEDLHFQWMDEIYRVLKKHGIFLFSTQGSAFKERLTMHEQQQFNKANLVVKANTKIGHRTFCAFHPRPFVERLVSNFKILEFVPGGIKNNKPEQDVWIIQKK